VSDKVVDASAFAAIAFKEPNEESVRARLRGHRLFAPYLLPYEIANVCWVKMKRNRAARGAIFEQFTDSQSVPIELSDVEFPKVVELASRLDLSVYDASYLWLAHRLDAELVTLDREMEKAAKRL